METIEIKEKRYRSSNFTREEEMLFLSEIEKYKDVLKCTAMDKINLRKRNEAWRKVYDSFNSKSRSYRSLAVLKNRFYTVKKEAKKIVTKNGNDFTGTGGGDDLDPIAVLLKIRNEQTCTCQKHPSTGDSTTNYEPKVEIIEEEAVEVKEYEEEVMEEVKSEEDITEEEPVEEREPQENIISNERHWGRYTSDESHFPVPKRLGGVGTDSPKDLYFKKRIELMEAEIRKKKLEGEEILIKRKRDDEKHRKEMMLLDLAIKNHRSSSS